MPFLYIGKVDKKLIIDAYNDFHSIDCDLLLVKAQLLNIVSTYCNLENIFCSTFNLDDCKVSLCKTYGLKMTGSKVDDLVYYFCINTGKIYCSTSTEPFRYKKRSACVCVSM